MTNLIDALHIPDTQSAHDDRRIAIQRVGIRGVRYPMQL
ncbi:MAG: GTP cyclohydrolase I FolE2, partial [Caldimonas sp.]